MKRRTIPLWGQISALLVMVLALVWSVAFYELYRTQQTAMHDAELETVKNAQIFAEYSRSTLKRINEFILEARRQWTGDWQSFASVVKRGQENIADISLQVAIIDKDGIMQFSNLAKPNDRVDLSDREHFRAHRDAPGSDRLFISRPLLGKVSGKWSIQVTRAIITNGEFAGVIVVSLSPDQFASFAEKLNMGKGSVMTVIRSTGEIMARYPGAETSLGNVLKDRPFLAVDAPLTANYRQVSLTDGVDRIWGYNRLPEYGMSFVLGEAVNDVLTPYHEHRIMVLLGATAVSALALLLSLVLFRSLFSLEELQRQLDAIFALSPDGFVSFDNEHRVKYISPTFFSLTGLESADVQGVDEVQFAERLATLCVDQAAFPTIEAMRSAQKQRTATGGEDSNRQLIELAGAGKRVLEVGIRLSTAGSVSQVLYFRDVTHETEVDRMKSEFLSMAAHELRTPMASIQGFSELLLSGDYPPAERHEMLGIVHRQSELMAAIINELLDLVRIEERRGKDFEFVQTDVGQLVQEVVSDFGVPAGHPPAVADVQKGQSWILADQKKMMQSVRNILSNAYKYSPAGGEVVIRLVSDTPAMADATLPQRVGIRITDHGIGMTPSQTARVCERFYRADASGSIPGTGLGMSIVKEIVELHGGSVEIESALGVGTTVTLWMNAIHPDAVESAS